MDRRGGTVRVIGWAHQPGKAEQLLEMLSDTRDDELVALMVSVGGPSGHIAWAEFGKRRYGVEYGIEAGRSRPLSLPSQMLLA